MQFVNMYLHTIMTEWKVNCNHQHIKITYFILSPSPLLHLCIRPGRKAKMLGMTLIQCQPAVLSRDAGRVCRMSVPKRWGEQGDQLTRPNFSAVEFFPVRLPEGRSIWDRPCQLPWLKPTNSVVYWSCP